jgi:hypothetical protein
MGADFTFAKFPYFDMGDDAREHFRTMIDNLDEDQLNEWEEWHGEPLDKEDLLALVSLVSSLSSALLIFSAKIFLPYSLPRFSSTSAAAKRTASIFSISLIK